MYSLDVAIEGYLLCKSKELNNYISVDHWDVFKLDYRNLVELKISHIATSAATNPLFDLRILYLALKADIQRIIMPTDRFKSLRDLNILQSLSRQVLHTLKFADAEVQPDKVTRRNGGAGCKRPMSILFPQRYGAGNLLGTFQLYQFNENV